MYDLVISGGSKNMGVRVAQLHEAVWGPTKYPLWFQNLVRTQGPEPQKVLDFKGM
jgi:hypothetical protein